MKTKKPKFLLPKTHPKIEKGIPMPFRKCVGQKPILASFSAFMRKLETGDSFTLPVDYDASVPAISTVHTAAKNNGIRIAAARISETEIRFWRKE